MIGDLNEFREASRKFYSGESTLKEYKGISTGYGSAAQRGGELGMIRLRMTGGSVGISALASTVALIEKYNVSLVHITTCQSIQLHNIPGDRIPDAINDAWNLGLFTLGGGGDYPRNVMASPLSGVEPGENFDVLPFADEAWRHMMPLIGNVKLPRKLKVGFANSPKNDTHATFKDIGFVATEEGGFDVYVAGGLGQNPKFGVRIAENIEPKKFLYYIDAMVNTFVKHGNYEDRSKARTRYMRESLGEEGFIKAFNEELEAVMNGKNIDVDIPVVRPGNDVPEDIDKRIHGQSNGLYYVTYHPLGGDPTPRKMSEFLDIMEEYPDVGMRIASDETIYFINCTKEQALDIMSKTDDGADTVFESSVSCVGAKICQIGISDSRGLLGKLIEMSRKNGFADGVLPRIRISGCTSSCGAHQIGSIGFRGAPGGKDENGPIEAFEVTVEGSHLAGEERFGEKLGKMRTVDIPAFLEEVGKAVGTSDFYTWLNNDPSVIREIASKYLI